MRDIKLIKEAYVIMHKLDHLRDNNQSNTDMYRKKRHEVYKIYAELIGFTKYFEFIEDVNKEIITLMNKDIKFAYIYLEQLKKINAYLLKLTKDNPYDYYCKSHDLGDVMNVQGILEDRKILEPKVTHGGHEIKAIYVFEHIITVNLLNYTNVTANLIDKLIEAKLEKEFKKITSAAFQDVSLDYIQYIRSKLTKNEYDLLSKPISLG